MRGWQGPAVAVVLLLAAGCGATGTTDVIGDEDLGRSSTPAPTAVEPPSGVAITVEELAAWEPVATDASVELDPDELRASWREERLASAGGRIERDPDRGLLVHRYEAIVIRWDTPKFAEANVFFLAADDRQVSAFDTNDEFGTWGYEPVPQAMEFVLTRSDLAAAGPDATWTLTSGWAHYGWYLDEQSEAEVIRSEPVVLDLPALPDTLGADVVR